MTVITLILFILCLWSLGNFLLNAMYSSISIINFNIPEFFVKLFRTAMYLIIFTDSFLRLFSTNSTGLW